MTALTIVSPMPRLKIPAKGARGRSLYPEDNHIGRAHPNKREKWLRNAQRYGGKVSQEIGYMTKKYSSCLQKAAKYLMTSKSESRWSVKALINWWTGCPKGQIFQI